MAAQVSLSLLFLTLFFLSHLSLPFAEPKLGPTVDVHDLLPVYGLPKGLLPNNVKSYSLSSDGDFSIELESPCYLQFVQLVYYDNVIKGKLSYGAVGNVSGIQVKRLFVWVPVTGIEVDKDDGGILFFLGPLSEKLPADVFATTRLCLIPCDPRTAFEYEDIARKRSAPKK